MCESLTGARRPVEAGDHWSHWSGPRKSTTFRLRDGCSASAWTAPDGSSLLTLDASSVQMAPDGSRRIIWMIKRMIKGHPTDKSDGKTGRSPPRRSRIDTDAPVGAAVAAAASGVRQGVRAGDPPWSGRHAGCSGRCSVLAPGAWLQGDRSSLSCVGTTHAGGLRPAGEDHRLVVVHARRVPPRI